MKWCFLLAALFCLVPPSALAQAPDTFTFTGSMSIQRQSASATLISGCNCPADGKVLVAGGVIDNDLATTKTADLYDPATGIFTPTGTMNVARSGQAAVLLPGGKVLMVGAFDSTGPEDAEIYDPVAGTFSCVAGTDPATGNCNATLVHNATVLTATLLQTGKVLITGLQTPASSGQGSNAAAVYDPSQNTFTCVSGLSSTPGVCNPSTSSLHINGTATLLPNGTVLVAGGTTASGYTSAAEIYDPTSGTNGAFTTTGSLLTTRGYHTATLLNTGEVLVAGGTTDTGSIHNLNTAEVFANGTFASVGNMTHVRVYQTATLLNDGTVLIAGGCCEVSNLQMAYAEVYNSATKAFASTADMNEARATHTATFLPNGQVLVTGGLFSATAELYTPGTPPPPPPVTITSVSPTSVTQGQTITNFTVNGTEFDTSAVLAFTGSGVSVNSYISRSSTQIVASVTVTIDASPGARGVTVANPDGQQANLENAFQVVPSCSVTSIQIDPRFSNGVIDASEIGSSCQYTITITNPKSYWTNFVLDTSGPVTVQPVGPFDLYFALHVLAPGKPIKFLVRFSAPAQAVNVFVDPSTVTGLNASLANLLQGFLDLASILVPPIGNVQLAIEDLPQVIQAFAQMPHLTQTAIDLFNGRLNMRAALIDVIAFAQSNEPSILVGLLANLGVDIAENIFVDRLKTPGAIANFLTTLVQNDRSALFGQTAGSITIQAR